MDRAPEVQRVLDAAGIALRGETIDQAQAAARCHNCKKAVTGFTDAVSRREYEISGLCQECQDGFFGTGEDE